MEMSGSFFSNSDPMDSDNDYTVVEGTRLKRKYRRTTKDVKSVTNSQDLIWFIETSHKRKLTAREACSIESTCRHNGDYNVHLLSTGNISSSDCPYHRLLSRLPNFHSARLNVSVALAETPLRATEAALNQSVYKVVHLSDCLRYVVLWKRGGVYLDSDVIVVKSLKGIRNAVFYQRRKPKEVGNSILFFDKRHPVLGEIIDKCARVYNPNFRMTCGPALMSLLPSDTVLSRQVKFFNESAFFAVPWKKWRDLFHPGKAPAVLRATNASYGVHFWNYLSKKRQWCPDLVALWTFSRAPTAPRCTNEPPWRGTFEYIVSRNESVLGMYRRIPPQ
ncbi:hypothetical protein HPB49_010128 [Dermacentor silvarum]|uniref:Uncharacterized protein n=1 Tax=Dermacentor silvarum TaxID=543639 RepID=A0ACB8DC95_DERSI|nr:hypothetical protein HPB49_010128 [Dermacentor silvarum]